MEVAIDEDFGRLSEYVGRIHSSYPVTYINKQNKYATLFTQKTDSSRNIIYEDFIIDI